MQEADVAQVMAIEETVFVGDPWPRSAFVRQLDNPLAQFLVLALAGNSGAADQVLGYAGAWIIVDEAHLMNIAIEPGVQGQGLGEYLLLRVLSGARSAGATICTLEVRPSNLRAQRLYRRLGLRVVGRRKRYYVDNGEDALIMTSEALTTLAALHRDRLARIQRHLSAAYLLEP